MVFSLNPGQVEGLGEEEQKKLADLIRVYEYHCSRNAEKDDYYEGKISLNSVNLGLALPKGFHGLEISCSWGAKTVDVLAGRSRFDGFVSSNGEEYKELRDIVTQNNLIFEYMKACRDELKYGCTFATLSADEKIGCKIRFHAPNTSAALWNGEKGRIDCGFAIIDTVEDESKRGTWTPSVVNLYTEDAIWVMRKIDCYWYAEKKPNKMGRPLMEPLVWNATTDKPFGRSRIKYPIRKLIDSYVRTLANATIGLEFATTPQKYMLGITDEQYDTVVSDKFKQYAGAILAATYNPDISEKPSVGQFAQGTISPHTEMIRILATQFAAATGLSVADTGIVNDANPSSSEALLAQEQTLVSMAEQLNTGNGHSLQNIALMAMAISQKKTLEQLTDDEKAVVAHFKNPAMPSVSVTADAAIKIASAREGFGNTDVFAEMIGFDQADIRRIKSQEARIVGNNILAGLEDVENEGSDNRTVPGETE
ncbi:MAG: phage portal protein [Blautia sp.]|nr:phage portal protein [Blautia sp.]